MVNVLYVVGAGHCGSTLADVLLNSHSAVIGLGEVATIRRALAPGGSVGASQLQQEFWRRVASAYEGRSGVPFLDLDLGHPGWRRLWSVDRAALDAWQRRNGDFFHAVQSVSKSLWLTDTSKATQRLFLLQRNPDLNVKVVHLIRDGRGVAYSYFRKYGSRAHAMRRWAWPTIQALFLRRRFPPSQWLTIRYENVAEDPSETVGRIFDFMELPPEKPSATLDNYVGVRGNRMRRAPTLEIRLDNRWRTEMKAVDRLLFQLVGGPLNRLVGYRY